MPLPNPDAWLDPALAANGGTSLAQELHDGMLKALHATIGIGTPQTLVIGASGGLPAPARSQVIVDTFNGASLSDLDQISLPAAEPRLLLISLVSGSRKVRVRHDVGGDGKILLTTGGGSRFTLDNSFSSLLLRRSGANWLEISRSYGADQVGSNSSGEWCWIGPGRLRQTGAVTTSATAAVTVAFPKPFAVSAGLRLGANSVQGGEPGFEYLTRIWGGSVTGFNIKAFNNSGAQVAVGLHWHAEGQGE